MSARLPRAVEWGLLPALNLAAALLVSGLVVLAVGEDPLRALGLLVEGAIGYPEAIGYTLYYATNFIFTGLAVAIAFHAGLFNIGGEGQAYVGGLAAALICLGLDALLPGVFLLPWRSSRRRPVARLGRRSPAGCRHAAAAMSSSRPSCSTSSPRLRSPGSWSTS